MPRRSAKIASPAFGGLSRTSIRSVARLQPAWPRTGRSITPILQQAVHPSQRTWPDRTRAWYAGAMTAKQFRIALSTLNLTQAAAAELLGLGLRTVEGYANGRAIPVPVAILINLLVGGVATLHEVDTVR
jgi:hypothetical protein